MTNNCHLNVQQTPLPYKWWEAKARDNYDQQRPSTPRRTSPSPTHEDLVASLNFGTWTSILVKPSVTRQDNDRLQLWEGALSAGFDQLTRNDVYRYAHDLRWVRNRAAHLRPLLNTNELRQTHKAAIQFLRSMNTDYAQIIAGQATVPNIAKSKP